MFTVVRKPTPGFIAGLDQGDIREIMRQELALVGSVGEDPGGRYDIRITGLNTFEADEKIPRDAIGAAVERIFDRVMKKASSDVLGKPDEK